MKLSLPQPKARLPLVAALLPLSLACTAPTSGESESDTSNAQTVAARGITEPLAWLGERSEDELATLFAKGSATHVPLGANTGRLLLPRGTNIPFAGILQPFADDAYQGSVWEPVLAHGVAKTRPNGDPEVRLHDVFLRDGEGGGYVTLFTGEVTRDTLGSIHVTSWLGGPRAPEPPHPLSPYTHTIEGDGRPSLFVNYRVDATPFVRQILDEIREIDPSGCPGLFLGRAHFHDDFTGVWTYLYAFALDFGGDARTCRIALPVALHPTAR